MEFTELINKICPENCYIPGVEYPTVIVVMLTILVIVFLLSLIILKVKRIKYNIGYHIIRSIIITIIIFLIFIGILVLWKNISAY